MKPSDSTIRERIRRGWTRERAENTPTLTPSQAAQVGGKALASDPTHPWRKSWKKKDG